MPDKIPLETAKDYLDIIGRLRSMRLQTEAAQRDQERLEMQKANQIRDEQLQKMKFIITKRAQYWQGLGEGPSKDLAREQTRSYFNGLPGWAQEALQPFRLRLFDPQEEKLIQFRRMYGDEPRGSGASLEDNPLQYAYDQFAKADYLWQKQKALGYEMPFPTSIPLTGDLYAVRAKGDKHIKLMSLEREELKERYAKLPGSPSPEEVAGAGYKWHLSEGTTMDDGPTTYLIQPTINLQPGPDHGKVTMQTREMFTKEAVGEQKMPDKLRTFMSYAGTKGDDETEQGRQYKMMLRYIKAGMTPEDAVARAVGDSFLGWNVKLVDPQKVKYIPFTDLKWKAMSEKIGVVACPGHRVYLNGMNDTVHPMYYDETTGDFYTNHCAHVGKAEKATQWASVRKGMRK